MRTTIKGGYLTEHGPNSIMLNDTRIAKLLEQLGLNDRIIKADHSSAKRFIIKDGKPIAMPYSLKSAFFNKILTLPTMLRVACEPFIRKHKKLDKQSFADFVRHRLGKTMLNYAAGPFVNGIYAGDPEKLHFKLAFPRMYEVAKKKRSIILTALKKPTPNPNKLKKKSIISFQNGMQELPDAFGRMLRGSGCHVLTEISNSKIERNKEKWKYSYSQANETHQQDFDEVIITVPSHKLDTVQLPNDINLEHTKAIYHPPVSSLLLGYKRSDVTHPLDGFGMLASLPEKTDILGALFTSTLFPVRNRAPQDHVAINVMLGGTKNSEVVEQSEEELIATAHREISNNLGISNDPVFHKLTQWKQAIPQVSLNHQNVLDELTQIEKDNPGLKFAGNYRGGISVGDCLINGMSLAIS